MITIFSLPRNFEGHYAITQENAIQSWLKIVGVKGRSPCKTPIAPEIILFGDDFGTAEIAKKYNLRHEKHIELNQNGRPIVNYLFKRASQIAKYDTLVFVNSDIIVEPTLVKTVQAVKKKCQRDDNLLIAYRWDLDVKTNIDYTELHWFEKIKKEVESCGKLHSATGTDLFIFKRGLFDTMPDFAIGRTSYDNWMIWHARKQKVSVVDISAAVMLIHQNHLVAVHNKNDQLIQQETRQNLIMAGGYGHIYDLADASYRFTADGEIEKNRLPHNYFWRFVKRKLQLIRDFFVLK